VIINQWEEIKMLESGFLIPIILFVVGVSIVGALSLLNKNKPKSDSEEIPKEIELTERFCMSGYLGGLPNTEKAPLVFCGITEDEFIFRRGSQGAEIARLRRDSINDAIVGKKTQIAERLIEQEKSCLGKISESKKDKSYCLVLPWQESSGTKHNLIFEFAEQSFAEETAQNLKKWAKQKQMKESFAHAV
jgi:hypothetical protein